LRVSDTTRLSVPDGSTRSSTPPNCTRANGDASTSRTAVVPIAYSTGRRITLRAIRAQNPRSATDPVTVGTVRGRAHGSRSASTRRPSTASSAGSTVRLASIATATAATPPMPIDRRNICGKISSPDNASATVTPETATVRPAVAIVRDSASDVVCPWSNSSRNRLTTNSA